MPDANVASSRNCFTRLRAQKASFTRSDCLTWLTTRIPRSAIATCATETRHCWAAKPMLSSAGAVRKHRQREPQAAEARDPRAYRPRGVLFFRSEARPGSDFTYRSAVPPVLWRRFVAPDITRGDSMAALSQVSGECDLGPEALVLLATTIPLSLPPFPSA